MSNRRPVAKKSSERYSKVKRRVLVCKKKTIIERIVVFDRDKRYREATGDQPTLSDKKRSRERLMDLLRGDAIAPGPSGQQNSFLSTWTVWAVNNASSPLTER